MVADACVDDATEPVVLRQFAYSGAESDLLAYYEVELGDKGWGEAQRSDTGLSFGRTVDESRVVLSIVLRDGAYDVIVGVDHHFC